MLSVWFLALVASSLAQQDPVIQRDRAGVVQLFEWHYKTIADECESFLGPMKYGAVQISPPTENRIIAGRPWWERYQPVSYKLTTRHDKKRDLLDMITRCNRVGVRIYADVVMNHMVAVDAGTGHGTAGSYYDANLRKFEGVPYSKLDFNDNNCRSSSGNVENYQDENEVRNCRVMGLLDLNQGVPYVREKLINYMNELIGMGVAGFRIDAAKHMWPADLKLILDRLHYLPTEIGVPPRTKPFIFQQVIDLGNEAVKASEYFSLGRVTEFKYRNEILKNINKIQYLVDMDTKWGLMPKRQAVSFLDTHDTQRKLGEPMISFKDPYTLKIFTAYMMAYGYGLPKVMSSYYFRNKDQGPPSRQRIVKPDGTCGNGWVCEHRWKEIKNLAKLAAVAGDAPVINKFQGDNQLAFSRGRKAFLAINKQSTTLSQKLQTGLPAGTYCNVFLGEVKNGRCTGPCVDVGPRGLAKIVIHPSENPVVALHVEATVSSSSVCKPLPPPDVLCTHCMKCTKKIECGYLGIDQTTCEGRGCLWCPGEHGSTEPWCFVRTSDAGATCTIMDQHKEDCGFLGVDRRTCETKGCCWKKSSATNVPWCYYPK